MRGSRLTMTLRREYATAFEARCPQGAVVVRTAQEALVFRVKLKQRLAWQSRHQTTTRRAFAPPQHRSTPSFQIRLAAAHRDASCPECNSERAKTPQRPAREECLFSFVPS